MSVYVPSSNNTDYVTKSYISSRYAKISALNSKFDKPSVNPNPWQVLVANGSSTPTWTDDLISINNSINTANSNILSLNNSYNSLYSRLGDKNFLLAQNNTTLTDNVGVIMRHTLTKYSAIVKEQASGAFKLVDLSALPGSTDTFTAAQYLSLYLKDLHSTGGVKLYNTGGFNTTLQASTSQAANLSYTLPTTDGANGTALITNGSGTLSWSASSISTMQSSITSLNSTISGYSSSFSSSVLNATSTNTKSTFATSTLASSTGPAIGYLFSKNSIQAGMDAETDATANAIILNSGVNYGGTGVSSATTNRACSVNSAYDSCWIRYDSRSSYKRFNWYWRDAGSGSADREIMTLTSAGYLGLSNVNPQYTLDLGTDNARKLTTTTWITGSDIRVKDNVEDADIDICYNNVKALKLRRFKWREEYYPNISDRNVVGFIADEVEAIVPKAVLVIPEQKFIKKQAAKPEENEYYVLNDFKSVDVDQINKSLYGAVQKLIQKVEALEAEVQLLKSAQ